MNSFQNLVPNRRKTLRSWILVLELAVVLYKFLSNSNLKAMENLGILEFWFWSWFSFVQIPLTVELDSKGKEWNSGLRDTFAFSTFRLKSISKTKENTGILEF